ncbi:hypothetical protein GNI_036800 [Gregarina niphandrodes]|uniref:Uncharacterized protein n=1 Tax=Gregarina niphandrodes TaxID=110365 RepID=A0A023BAP4_GRENI|nr:hypothetical protein GNI_036800 [Gregarina niphandrodes]EZG78405.1 hypothetical protein GNI_036800 [Gregarina niphandrodes]|eukprot:XP_011129317.1 hypothetical protein GNI_036800 [Gregarina niphandrodes]
MLLHQDYYVRTLEIGSPNAELGITNDKGEVVVAIVPTVVNRHFAWKLIFSVGEASESSRLWKQFVLLEPKAKPEAKLFEALEVGYLTAMDMLVCMSFHDPQRVGSWDRKTRGQCILQKSCFLNCLDLWGNPDFCGTGEAHLFTVGDDTTEAHANKSSLPVNTQFIQSVVALLRYGRRDFDRGQRKLIHHAFNNIQISHHERATFLPFQLGELREISGAVAQLARERSMWPW